MIRGTVLGGLAFQERTIGEELYLRSPLLTALDGGKPWVSTSPAERAQEQEQAQSSEEDVSSPTSTIAESGFGKLIELLDHAGSVVELGRKVVDGQQTIEFEAKLDGEQLLSASSTSKPAKAEKKALRHSDLTLNLFLADDGLPVRTRMQTKIGKAEISVVEDVLATEISVSAQPPPASETITEAELKEHEEKSLKVHLTKRERKEINRFEACVKRHRPKGDRPLAKRERKQVLRHCPLPK